MKTVSVLGATGSVGKSTVDLLLRHRERFAVAAVVGGNDAVALAKVALALDARCAAIADGAKLAQLRDHLAGSGVLVFGGREGVLDAARQACDITVAAISGIAGLEPTHAALAKGRRIALANKECLVSAGASFMREAASIGATLAPLDSEHNAIFQALGGLSAAGVERVTITGSGGPFLRWSAEKIAAATVEDALRHPTWSMGAKITIDSASLMNKGLELLEAHYLFGLPPAKLEVVIHPQSIVHGLVEYHDGSTIAVMARPDMRIAISHGLGLPERLETDAARLNLASLQSLHFERPDLERFPALALALAAMAAGGGAPTILNAANEVAVAQFLQKRIGFADIPRLVEHACSSDWATRQSAPNSPSEALALDYETRARLSPTLALNP